MSFTPLSPDPTQTARCVGGVRRERGEIAERFQYLAGETSLILDQGLHQGPEIDIFR